jgi:hypothetical protein
MWRKRGTHTSICYQNLKVTNYLKDLGADGRIVVIFLINKCSGRLWTGIIRLMITCGRLL